jgi:hypothetical protein
MWLNARMRDLPREKCRSIEASMWHSRADPSLTPGPSRLGRLGTAQAVSTSKYQSVLHQHPIQFNPNSSNNYESALRALPSGIALARPLRNPPIMPPNRPTSIRISPRLEEQQTEHYHTTSTASRQRIQTAHRPTRL